MIKTQPRPAARRTGGLSGHRRSPSLRSGMQLRVIIQLVIIEAFRAIARNALRSALAMLGIAVAVAIVITVIALGRASILASEAELDKLGDNLIWLEAGSRNVAGARTGS